MSAAELMPVVDDAGAAQRLEQLAVEIEAIQSGMFFEIGKRLAEARDIRKYKGYSGGFAGWCHDRLSISFSAAERFVQVFDNITDKSLRFEGLSLQGLLEVSRADSDLQVLIAQRVAAGEIFTAEQVRQIRDTDATAAVRRLETRLADLQNAGEAERAEYARIERKLRQHEQRVAELAGEFPTPQRALEQAEESGAAVLANDAKYYRVEKASPDQRQAEAAYVALLGTLVGWRDRPDNPATIARGCPRADREPLVAAINTAIAYLNAVKVEIPT